MAMLKNQRVDIYDHTHRFHGAGILMLTSLGYIDGIHGTPLI